MKLGQIRDNLDKLYSKTFTKSEDLDLAWGKAFEALEKANVPPPYHKL